MQNILSLSDLHFLKELQKELKEQDRDCQASPRFWTIGDYEKVPCLPEYSDDVYLSWPNGDFFDDIEEFLEVVKINGYLEDLEDDDLQAFDGISDVSDAVEWLDKTFGDTSEEVYVQEVHKIHSNTMFLTKDDAKNHLRLNHYHYTNKAHTYAMTAWRSPVVARLIKLLENCDWDNFNK